ncbi:MAG: SDR family oxidoreductase [Caldilineaceae bacterium]
MRERAGHHPHHPPGGAASALLQGRPGGRRARQRGRDGQRLRSGQGGRLGQVVYASSIAVYGPAGHYADAILPADAPLFPQTHYGVYKQANEGTARIFWQDDGIASVALRPYTIYGPARDQGLTSEPTKAMLAAAQGDGYHIPFGGVMGYQHVEDVARIFVQAMRTPVEGAHAFNLRGAIADMPTVIAAIEAAVSGCGYRPH